MMKTSEIQSTFNVELSPGGGASVSVNGYAFVDPSVLWKDFDNEQDDLAGLLVVRRPEIRVVIDHLAVVVPGHLRHRLAADFAHEARLVSVHHLL